MENIWNERKLLDDDETTLLNNLVEIYKNKDWRDVLPLGGANNYDIELSGIEPLKDFLYGPTLNISGLRSGFLGKETGLIPFIIPSEATASIDSHTEKKIQLALKKLLKGRTGIVIAHRLATIRGADRIIVIKNGKLVEMGPHKLLVEKGGLYSQLHKLNYASFDDAPKD